MKYYFESADIQNMEKVLSPLAEQDSVVVLQLGIRDMDAKVLCMARLTTSKEQAIYQIQADKPKKWDSKPLQIGLSAKKLFGTILSLLPFKERIFLSVERNIVKLGVDGKAQVPVEIATAIPEDVKNGEMLMVFQVNAESFEEFSRKGCAFTSDDVEKQSGMNNAILYINPKNSVMIGISSDSYTLARAEMPIEISKAPKGNEQIKAQYDAMHKAYAAHCKEKGIDPERFALIVPRTAISHLRMLTEGAKIFTVLIDAKRAFVQIGNTLVYSFTQGAKGVIHIDMIDKMFALPVTARVAVDAGDFTKGIDFICKINSLDKSESKYPMKLDLSEEGLIGSSGASGQTITNMKYMGKDGSDAVANIQGSRVKAVLSALDKGGLVIKFHQQMVVLCNGNLEDGEETSAMIGVLMTRTKQENTEEDSEETETETGDEETEADDEDDATEEEE